MKKILFWMLFVGACTLSAVAQNRITVENYAKIVDYVNAKSVYAFTQKNFRTNKEMAQKTEVLNNCRIGRLASIPDYETIVDACSSEDQLNIAQGIEEHKAVVLKHVKKGESDEKIVDAILAFPTDHETIKKLKPILRKEIMDKIKGTSKPQATYQVEPMPVEDPPVLSHVNKITAENYGKIVDYISAKSIYIFTQKNYKKNPDMMKKTNVLNQCRIGKLSSIPSYKAIKEACSTDAQLEIAKAFEDHKAVVLKHVKRGETDEQIVDAILSFKTNHETIKNLKPRFRKEIMEKISEGSR